MSQSAEELVLIIGLRLQDISSFGSFRRSSIEIGSGELD